MRITDTQQQKDVPKLNICMSLEPEHKLSSFPSALGKQIRFRRFYFLHEPLPSIWCLAESLQKVYHSLFHAVSENRVDEDEQ